MTENIHKMLRYEAYKDSGVEWIGEIPEGWKISKLKYEASIVLGKMLCNDNKGNYHLKPYLKSKNIQWLNVDISSVDKMWFSKLELKMYRLKYNDLVLSEGGEVGKTCIWNNELLECYIQNSAHRVTFSKKNIPVFYLYFFYICGKTGFFESIVNRVSIGHLTHDKLSNIIIVSPPLHEQTTIAHFLDQKTTQIDQAIHLKEKQITLLKERQQILIQHAATCGLNPNAPLCDSRVEWIGEIPEHWHIRPNFFLFTERVESGYEGLPLLMVSIHSGVSEDEISAENNIRGRIKIADKSKYNLVEPHDIVFNMMRAWQGGIGAVKNKGMVSPAYIIATPNESINTRYFEYQYRSPLFIQQMDRSSKGITDFRKRLYWDEFKRLNTVVPPIKEQKCIVAYIEIQSTKINKAITLYQQQINKLKEYKATLINSAVTGKIKVPKEFANE